MRIVRFRDENGQQHTGCQYNGTTATVIRGDIFSGMEVTNQKVAVRQLLSPVQPTAILCIGLNYKLHATETGIALPPYPVLFLKNPGAVTGPGAAIEIPVSCLEPPQVDYEAELAVIIGKKARNVRREEALNYVLGYTCGNDVSARDWQKNAGGRQWCRGKGFDTFCPLGPELVTVDEIADPQRLAIQCRLNLTVMQSASTADMIFTVAEIISYLSESTTLMPGTVILTGTPSGVGFARKPPVFLQPGDQLETIIEGIGTLSNPVVAERR
ncbi:MAG: fumarylacetoacetate hydrolase family protein [Desulfocapsaceae bacterium]|nr:fumarylacetoacetate hydrolase family protein [Desulfocapsaceae bacterium]